MPKYDANLHHRNSIRLWGYAYDKPRAYFITACVTGTELMFGEVVDGEMV